MTGRRTGEGTAHRVRADELAAKVRARHAEVFVARGEAMVVVERGELLETLAELRDDPALELDSLSSVTATDWPDRDPRFWISYELYSLAHRHRLRVQVGLPHDDPSVPSVVELFPTANWHERETYDFYGIVFVGHPDLRRILLPDGWKGWPLRKTEELGGVDTSYKGAFIPPVDKRST